MPGMDRATAIESMLSEERWKRGQTDAERIASLERQLASLYKAFVVMEHERDEALRASRTPGDQP